MSSSLSRAPLRTYAKTKRKHIEDDDAAVKRRRVVDSDDSFARDQDKDTTDDDQDLPKGSTQPQEVNTMTAISSDMYTSDSGTFSGSGTPASSPPPLQSEHTDKDASSTMPKTRSPSCPPLSRQVLASVNANTSPAGRPKAKRLVQMKLCLGQSVWKKCKDCGMDYMPSDQEDFGLHREYHGRFMNGIEHDKAFRRRAERLQRWRSPKGDIIIAVSRADTKALQKNAQDMLQIAQRELGAVHISEEMLWGLCDIPSPPGYKDEMATREEEEKVMSERYRVYLYIQDARCVGLLLAERIDKAMAVLEPSQPRTQEPGTEESGKVSRDVGPLCISQNVVAACMGVSRIWTASNFRHKGVAIAMLECASATFRDDGKLPPHMVAFSQPTESGACLARKWWGRPYGWNVYID